MYGERIHPRTERALLLGMLGLLLALAMACSSSRSNSGKVPGATLFVEVRDRNGKLVPDAAVTMQPATEARTTDAAGSALFSDVPPGFYSVAGVHVDAGAASKAVELRSRELTSVFLELDGVFVGSGGSGTGGTGGSSGATGGSSGGSGATGGSSGGSDSTGGTSGEGGGGAGSDNAAGPIDAATQIEAMLVDPVRPYLYAVDRVNNSLLFVNIESGELEKTIFVGSSPVDLDLGADGDELYIANFGSTEIAVIDLETQEVGRTVFVDISQGTWEGNPYRIAVTADDTLVFTEEDQWCDLKLVSSATGVHIGVAGGIYQPDITASPDGKHVYAGEDGISTVTLIRFDVTSSTIMQADISAGSNGYGARKVVLSGDGSYVFYDRRKFLASNLKSVLGQYSEVIHAANEDGTLVVGNTNVFDGVTFSVVEPLPVSTTIMAMGPDFRSVYLYDVNTSMIHVHRLGQ